MHVHCFFFLSFPGDSNAQVGLKNHWYRCLKETVAYHENISSDLKAFYYSTTFPFKSGKNVSLSNKGQSEKKEMQRNFKIN